MVCTRLMNEKTPAETVIKEINNNNNNKKKKKKKNDALAGCATGALGIHTYLHTYLRVEKQIAANKPNNL